MGIKGVPTFRGGIPSRVIYDTLGVSQPALTYWIQRGVIKPSVRRGKQGKLKNGEHASALWSFEDVLEVKAILSLRSQGLSLQRIRKVLTWLRAHGYSLDSNDYMTDGYRFFVRDTMSDSAIEILEAAGQYVCFPWASIVKMCIETFEATQKKRR